MPTRADGKGIDLPGGVVEIDETPQEAARREADEECGLIVAPKWRIGEPFYSVTGGEGEEAIATYLFVTRVLGGYLRTGAETTGFWWVSFEALRQNSDMVAGPKRGYPNGKIYALAERALTYQYAILSTVEDPDGLAQVL